MDKRMIQRNRTSTVGKIKKQMFNLCREDLLEIQRAIVDLLPSAPPAPPEEKLTTPEVWLEERHFPSGDSSVPDSYFVYRHWIDNNGKERRSLIFRGTLADYKAQRI